MKKSLLFLSSLLLFFCLLIFPARTFFYACEGVNLWFHTILPSLLPFLILTSLLLETGAARRISARAEVFFQTVFGLSPAGFYALFLGLFCGFPMGARITAQLYEAEEIDRNEACYLLSRNAWFIPLRFPLLMPDHIPVRQLLPLAFLLPEHPAGRAHFCSEQRYCSSLSGILQSCCISLLHRLMQSS